MMADGIVREQEMLEVTGYSERGRLVSHLKKNGIRFFVANHGQVWATSDAINAALLSDNDGDEGIEF